MTFLSIPLCSHAKFSQLSLISSLFAHATHYLSIVRPNPSGNGSHSSGTGIGISGIVAIIGAIAALITAFAAWRRPQK